MLIFFAWGDGNILNGGDVLNVVINNAFVVVFLVSAEGGNFVAVQITAQYWCYTACIHLYGAKLWAGAFNCLVSGLIPRLYYHPSNFLHFDVKKEYGYTCLQREP